MAQERFFFLGNAVAVGGRITAPFEKEIPAQAATSLPIVGGHAEAHVDGYNFEGLIHVNLAHSIVTGRPATSVDTDRSTRTTITTVTLQGLDVLGVLTASEVVAKLVSVDKADAHEMSSFPKGSYFGNLRINGEPVVLKEVDPLFNCDTFAKLNDQKGIMGRDGKALAISPFKPRQGNAYDDCVHLTYVYDPPFKVVPGLGTVYFGEFLMTRYSRRLTMLRIELDSPPRGEVALAGVEGNGTRG